MHTQSQNEKTSIEVNKSCLEYFEQFYRFEVAQNLFAAVIKGRCFWDYVRSHICNEYIYSKTLFEFRKTLTWHSYVNEAAIEGFYFVRNFCLPKKDYDLVVINYSRTGNWEGREVNITTYPIIQKLRSKYRILLLDPSCPNETMAPKYGCDILWMRPFHILSRLWSYFMGASPEEIVTVKGILRQIKSSLGIEFSFRVIFRNIFLYQVCSSRIYSYLFKKYRPKAVLFADTGNCKGLIEAANRLGIASVDLQHCLISKLNVIYTYPENIQNVSLPTQPSHIFTFGGFWDKQYRTASKRMSVGWPYFELLKKIALEKNKGIDKGRNIIVIASPLSRNALVEAAIRLAESMPDFTIFFKIHPEEYHSWQDYYPEKKFRQKKNIRMIVGNEPTLYDCFSACSWQIGVHSNALWEGLGFGLATFVLKTGWYEEMEDLYKDGHAFLVSGADEIAVKIRGNEKPRYQLNMEAVYKGNSLQNIETAVDAIVQSRSGETCFRAGAGDAFRIREGNSLRNAESPAG